VIVAVDGRLESTHNLAANTGSRWGTDSARGRALKEMPSSDLFIAYELKDKTKSSELSTAFVSMNFPAGGQNGFLLNEGFLDKRGGSPLHGSAQWSAMYR